MTAQSHNQGRSPAGDGPGGLPENMSAGALLRAHADGEVERESAPLQTASVERLLTDNAAARVLARTYGHRPHYLACHQEGRLTALIPVMEVCSVFTGRRGVCVG